MYFFPWVPLLCIPNVHNQPFNFIYVSASNVTVYTKSHRLVRKPNLIYWKKLNILENKTKRRAIFFTISNHSNEITGYIVAWA